MSRLVRAIRMMARRWWADYGEGVVVLAQVAGGSLVFFALVGWLSTPLGGWLSTPGRPTPLLISGFLVFGLLTLALLLPVLVFAIVRDVFHFTRRAWRAAAPPPEGEEVRNELLS